jgi:ankyrin repeat protein
MLAGNPELARAADSDGASALLKAVYHRRPDVAQALLETGLEPDISEAAALGRTERVRELVAADPEQANALAPDGFFPLALATFFGHPEAVNLLLKAGAEVNAAARNSLKVAPLHAACASAQIESARMLLQAGADPNVRQQQDFTPVHSAAAGHVQLVRLLLEHGADPNLRSADGRSALGHALQHGQTEAADLLRSRGGVE